MENPQRKQCEFDSEDLILRLNMSVPGEPAAVSPVVDQIMEIVSDMGCAEGKEHEIELALQEALANAVVHGCQGDPSRHVQVTVGCDQSRGMLILIRDPGPGFDPSQIPSPIVGQNIFASHGRGVYLINQLMDEVRYDKGGTEILMRKR